MICCLRLFLDNIQDNQSVKTGLGDITRRANNYETVSAACSEIAFLFFLTIDVIAITFFPPQTDWTVFAQVFSFTHCFPFTFDTNFKARYRLIQISVMSSKWQLLPVFKALNFQLFMIRILGNEILRERQTTLNLKWYKIVTFDQFYSLALKLTIPTSYIVMVEFSNTR